jgi:hypothetical protein
MYQKTTENQMKNVLSKNSHSSEKYLFSFNSNYKEKYFNSIGKNKSISDFVHKNLYSEDNLKKNGSETKVKIIGEEVKNEKDLFEIKSNFFDHNKNNKDHKNNKNKKFDSSTKGLVKLQDQIILSKKSNKVGKKSRIPLKGLTDSKTFGEENCDGENIKNINNNNLYNNSINNNDNNTISNNNTQIENINSKKSFISNSNRQNSNNNINPLKHSNNQGPMHPKHIDSILNNSINLNDLYEKFDLKQSMKITSQNGKKSKVICLQYQKADVEIKKNSHNRNPYLPRKSSKIQLFKELIKTPPLPLAMENFNQNVKTRKTNGLSASNTALNFYKPKNNKDNNSNKNNSIVNNFVKINLDDHENIKLRNELSNRYRKKKINIDEVLILHNTNIRKQLNPVKTKEFHMKYSMHRKDKLFGMKSTTKLNCFNKGETYQLKRENLLKFEKPI